MLLRSPDYRRLVVAAMLSSAARAMEQIAVGWFVFVSTESVLLTGLAWSVRSLPNLVFGGFAGVLADRYPRHRLLAINTGVRVAVVVLMAVVVIWLDGSITLLLLLVGVAGCTQTVQLASLQSLATSLAPEKHLGTAVSVLGFMQRVVTIPGALIGGWLLSQGVAVAFVGAASVLMLSAFCFASLAAIAVPHAARSFGEDLREGISILAANRLVRQLLLLMVVVEIFGFAFNAFLPVLVNTAYGAGPQALGWLTSAAGVGAMCGGALLSARAEWLTRGPTLIAIVFGFGAMIIALASVQSLFTGIIVVAFVGAAAMMIDSLEWALLQGNVAAEFRGRVLGAWNVAIGFGWVGPIGLGVLADAAGVTVALTLAGAVVCVTALCAGLSRTLRRAKIPAGTPGGQPVQGPGLE